jgi:hypothetical protein
MRRAPVFWMLAIAAGLLGPARAWGQGTDERGEVERLVAALLGDTPLVADLEALTDEIGGRATGSAANLRAVEWAVERLRAAGVAARKEPFTMPGLWLERAAAATVRGDGIAFAPRIAAMPFSAATPPAGVTAPLVDGGRGGEADFARLGAQARGAFVLIEQDELRDIDGLFREYLEAAAIEPRAFAAGALGVVYMGSRPNDLLYRHNAALAQANTHPLVVMERDGALRALRLLRHGKTLTLTVRLDLVTGPAYQSANVVAELPGTTKPDEIVVIGAHLDSWDLGDGALDDGANVALVIDLARQFRRLDVRPARTVRFVLWNGEEQGMLGSWGYVSAHAAELDRHAMAAAFDIGCGRITGFFTNGQEWLGPALERALAPVAGLGPFTHVNAPIVGTDNFDFMLQGVPNLVANQEPATYGPNYHARSDTFDKCDVRELRLNAGIAAAVAHWFANADYTWHRQTRAEIERLVATTDLARQMRMFGGLWEAWTSGARGRPR